ncbi:MAG TPA: hypothetical protein VGM63_15160 [Mucilaginibacter sp.]
MFEINREKNTIDLQGLPRWDLTWGKNPTYREVYGFNIMMPDAPQDKYCINYGLPLEDQIFRKTEVPDQVRHPGRIHDDPWTEEQIDYFVDTEYYRRFNGVWIFIKGEKYWMPGKMYLFQNYWPLQSGNEAVFRFTSLELDWIWIDTCRDERLFGLWDFKCRQIGDTEWALFTIWESASSWRNKKFLLQSSIGGDQIEKSYDRLVFSHNKMIWFFKPINRGTENPAQGLELKYPVSAITLNKIKAQQEKSGTNTQSNLEYEYDEINSEIIFGPSKERWGDGQTWMIAYLDEFGKADTMNPVATLNVIRPALFSRIINRKTGNFLGTSTVEEMKSGRSLKWAKQIYEQSKINPNTGTSLNGCRAIFRSALDRAPVDHWGFPMKEAERVWIEAKSKEYLEAGDIRGMLDHQRANPITIEQVFASANDESQFDIEKLAMRQQYLHSSDYKNPRTNTNVKPWVRGNLRWKDNNKETGEAVWEPNSKGRWLISAHPKDHGLKENAKTAGVWRPKPSNTQYYRCGIDPFEQKKTITDDWSMGGIAVKRVLDDFIDGKEDRYYQFTDEARGIKTGDPVDGGIHFLTNRYCCTYLYRQNDPEDFYEDAILTCVYYGTEFLPEKNKANGLLKHFTDRKHELYIMDKPNLTKNAKGKSEEQGVTATEKTIDEYFGHLMTLSCRWANTIDHPDILEQLLTMNWDNRGTKDLGVAVGWCEYACKVPNFYKPKTIEQKSSVYYTENYV